MRFKEFLNEGLSDAEIRKKIAQIRKEVKKFGRSFGKFTLVNGELYFNSIVLTIEDCMIENGKLTIPFRTANHVRCWNRYYDLSTFENFPTKLSYVTTKNSGVNNNVLDFYFSQPRLTSLEHFPREIGGDIETLALDNLNLTKCNKHIDYLKGSWKLSPRYIGPMLSIILIKDIEKIETDYTRRDKKFDILNKHLKDDKDILECQEELIQHGYKEFAKI